MRILRQLWIVIGTLVGAFLLSWLYYMPDAEQRGVWRSATGGNIISLGPLQAKVYSEVGSSCVLQLTFPAHLKLVELAEGATVTPSGDQLILRVDGALDPMPFDRIAALPAPCGPASEEATPAQVFNVMWTAMNDHYAFFDLHGVDWAARRALAPAPDDTLSDAALFDLLSSALVGLDDGHVQLVTPVGAFSPSEEPDWFPEDASFDRAALWQIARDTVGVDLTPVDLTGIEYSLLPDGVGYVMIRHMGLQTPFGARSEPAMAAAFAEVALAMENATALIIDLRYNPGGSDSVAFGVASHFTDAPLDVLSKTTRDGDGQSDPYTATLMPFDLSPLTQPTIVLTSGLTGSAAEILTMALREMPQVTTMGESTSGGLSDILSVTLPNGWDLGLSHQTYRTADGMLYEGIGVPPDDAFDIAPLPLLNGDDPLLRAAFAQARSASP